MLFTRAEKQQELCYLPELKRLFTRAEKQQELRYLPELKSNKNYAIYQSWKGYLPELKSNKNYAIYQSQTATRTMLFTRAGVPDDSNLLLGFDGERDAFEGWREGVVVTHAVLVESDGTLVRPIAGHLTARTGYGALCLKILRQGEHSQCKGNVASKANTKHATE